MALLFAVAAAAAAPPVPTRSAPDTGTITGRVRYVGREPPPLIVFEGGGEAEQKVVHVEPSARGLRFAVVYLDAAKHASGAALPTLTIDQAGWMFQPPVVAVRAGQPVRFTNGDGANHNVQSNDERVANRFNETTSMSSYTHRFEGGANPGVPVAIRCDLHAWMIAWVFVFEHGYHAVTDAEGRFVIPDVPAGSHHLHIRQPGGGLERDLDVQVIAGRPASVDVTFDTPDLQPWKPRWPSQDP